MRTSMSIFQSITSASDNNQMMELIKIHDTLLTVDIGIITHAMKALKRNEIAYSTFMNASKLSKVDSNGIKKRIIRQALKRDSVAY